MPQFQSRFITLDNGRGLSGTFSTLGAGVRSLSLDGEPLLLELRNPDDYLSSLQFFGKTLGRVAGRIPGEFQIGSNTYKVPSDEKDICLHGGLYEGLSFRDFAASVHPSEEGPSIVFHYLSKDGEAGFPGDLDLQVIYSFPKDEDALLIRYKAISNKDTLLSLSNHMYWNILRSKDVNDYKLFVDASEIGKFKRGTQLIVGTKKVPTCLDFRKMPDLKTKLDEIEKDIPEIGTLDHTFVLNQDRGEKPACILEAEKLTLETYTDYDAVNFYVDSSKQPGDFINNKDVSTGLRRAIAIEPELFPALDNILLKANTEYSHYMKFKIVRK